MLNLNSYHPNQSKPGFFNARTRQRRSMFILRYPKKARNSEANNFSLSAYFARCRRSTKVATTKLWWGRVSGVRRPKSKEELCWASWSRHHRTSSQVWRKEEGGQSKEVDQLNRLPMLTATLFSPSIKDSKLELRPQVRSKDRQWSTSSSTFIVSMLRLEKVTGVVAASWRVSRACTMPSTKGPISAGGPSKETSVPKSLCVKTLCQFSSSEACWGLPSFNISGHLEPGNRCHLPFHVLCPPHLHLHFPLPVHPSLSTSSSSLLTDSWDAWVRSTKLLFGFFRRIMF